MTNKEASIIIGNIPIDRGDDCYTIAEYQEAKAMAIKALEAEPCEDAISLEDAIEAVYGLCDKTTGIFEENPHIDAVREALENIPSVNPQPKAGHWIDKSKQSGCGVNFIHIECSECGEPSGLKNTYARYCPWCGARMIEPQESEG